MPRPAPHFHRRRPEPSSSARRRARFGIAFNLLLVGTVALIWAACLLSLIHYLTRGW